MLIVIELHIKVKRDVKVHCVGHQNSFLHYHLLIFCLCSVGIFPYILNLISNIYATAWSWLLVAKKIQ